MKNMILKKKIDKAVKLFESKNFQEALRMFLDLNTNEIAQYYIGAMYHMGLGVKSDYILSLNCFLKAAEKSHMESQFLVGCIYSCKNFLINRSTILVKQKNLKVAELIDSGIEPDEVKAFKWINESAKQGYVEAIIALGDLYSHGIGVEQNEEISLTYYQEAALKGSGVAYRKVALHFLLNEDELMAIQFLNKAYSLGDSHSAYRLAQIYEDINIEEAIKWYKISAKRHNWFLSYSKLGDIYYEKKLDYTQSVIFYKKAIKSYEELPDTGYLGNAYRRIYELYQKGYKKQITTIELIEYLKKASDYNNDYFRIKLRAFYLEGYDIGNKYTQLFQLLEKAELGDKQAQIEYGYFCFTSGDIELSTAQSAIEWYYKDAENDNSDAQYLLSKIFSGIYDDEKRIYWLEKAASNGLMVALEELVRYHEQDEIIPLNQ